MQPRYRGPAGASGSPWVLLQTTDQGSSPSDPTGFAASASFDSATGLFDVTTTAVATDIDGFREGWVRWTTPWLTAFPGFDPTTDIAEVLQVFSVWPVTGSKFGIAHALLDKNLANLATSAGFSVGVYDNTNTPSMTISTMASTAPSTVSTNATGTAQALRGQYQYRRHGSFALGGVIAIPCVKFSNSLGFSQPDINSVALASADPATWYLHQGVFHDGTVAAAGTRLAWKTYTRRIRLGSNDP